MPKVINHASQHTYSRVKSPRQRGRERVMESSPTFLQKTSQIVGSGCKFPNMEPQVKTPWSLFKTLTSGTQFSASPSCFKAQGLCVHMLKGKL